MCSKDQLMNIPFLFTVLPEAVARFSATCVSCLPKSCLDWVCPALNHIPHPAGQDLHLDQPWPIRPLAEVWNDTSVTSSATYLPNVQRYVTASRWSLPCSTPQTRTQGALKGARGALPPVNNFKVFYALCSLSYLNHSKIHLISPWDVLLEVINYSVWNNKKQGNIVKFISVIYALSAKLTI